MTYKEFVNKYNGKYTDYDGYYGFQCWDLGQRYFTEVLKLPASVLSGCGLVSNMLKAPKINLMRKYFDEVKTPKQGDVAIWEYGHIAIFDRNNNFYFSQNPNPCRVIQINRGGVHYFRLKSSSPAPAPAPAPANNGYYPKYNGRSGSIVDALKSLRIDSSFSNRRKIAKANGIGGYVGTPAQNIKMLNLLKQGKLKK